MLEPWDVRNRIIALENANAISSVEVVDYGATDDNESDNAARIQNALDAAYSSGINDIVFPYTKTGIYKISSGIRVYPGQTLRSLVSCFWPLTNKSVILKFTGASGKLLAPAIPTGETNNLRLLGLQFDGGIGADVVLDWTRVGYSKMEDCRVTGSKAGAVGLLLDDEGASACYFNDVRNSRFDITGSGASVNISLRGNSTSGANYNDFTNLWIGYASRGIEIDQYSIGTDIIGVQFQGIQNVDKALYINGAKTSVKNCFFEDCTTAVYIDTLGTWEPESLRFGGSITTRIVDNGNYAFGIYAVPDDSDTSRQLGIMRVNRFKLQQNLKSSKDCTANIDIQPITGTGTSTLLELWRYTNVQNGGIFRIYKPDGTETIACFVNAGTGDVGISGKLYDFNVQSQLTFLGTALVFERGSGSVESFYLGPVGSASASYVQNNAGLLRLLRGDNSNYCEVQLKSTTYPIPFVITWGASTALNFDKGRKQTLQIGAGNTNFTTTNKSIGREVEIYITGDTVDRTPTWPVGWKWVGATPVNIVANTNYILTLFCTGSTDADIYASITG